MKLLITESSVDKLVSKILNSRLKIMPDENASKLIKSYLSNNKNTTVEELIFIKLDSYGLKIIEDMDKYKIFFVKSPDDTIATISYDMSDGWCHIHIFLVSDIRNMFGDMDFKLSIKKIISSWVESKIPGWKVKNADTEGVFSNRELDMTED